MMFVVITALCLSSLVRARASPRASPGDVCAHLGLAGWGERNDNNVVCYNSSEQAHYFVSSLKNSNVR